MASLLRSFFRSENQRLSSAQFVDSGSTPTETSCPDYVLTLSDISLAIHCVFSRVGSSFPTSGVRSSHFTYEIRRRGSGTELKARLTGRVFWGIPNHSAMLVVLTVKVSMSEVVTSYSSRSMFLRPILPSSPPPPSLPVLGRCSISQPLSSWDLGTLQPCVSGVPLLTKASDLYRVLLQTSSPPSAITSSTLSKPYINDLPWESEVALISLLMLSISGGFTGVLFVQIVLYSACVKSSSMGSSDSVLSRASCSFGETLLPPYSSLTERDGFSDLLPSVYFSFLIGLYSCVAVSTGSEDAIEITLVFFVDEVWTTSSHYVTIVHLPDSVVKAPPTHSSTVLNSLSSSIEDLSYLACLSVVVYVYCQRGWIISSGYCIVED